MDPTAMNTVDGRTQALRVWLAACYVLTLLVLMPLQPGMPAATVDASTHYAMNAAVANHLRLGTDLVSGFGPLASAYSHQYSPGTDILMLLASWVFSTAIFLGFAVLALQARAAWLLLAVPVILSQLGPRDIVFMGLPLMLLLAAEAKEWNPWHRGAMFFIAAACAMLPLAVGSLAVPVAFCTLLAIIALWDRSPRDAVILVAVELVAIVAAWLASGQSWPDLPRHFISQLPLWTGYSQAMAVTGPMEEILAFLGIALVLVVAVRLTVPHPHWRIVLATLSILFLCFQSGFVRHDAHALIPAGALVLVGFLIVLQRVSIISSLALVASLAGWAVIAGNYEPMDPVARADRLARAITAPAGGLFARVFDPEALPESFRAANRAIAQREPLPRTAGTADLYGSDTGAVLASGARWTPRPVPQSQLVYTPELAALNEAHLRWGGPERVYVGLGAVDGRYPSMADGSSWPVLLANYQSAGIAGSHAILDRRPTPARVDLGAPLFEGARTLGAVVPVPGGGPVWAQIDIGPTILGQVASALFKLPELTLVVRYADHSRRNYRLVPGAARSGFVLSPTITTPAEFIALQSGAAQDQLAAKVPVSFTVHGERGTSLLWKRTYGVRLAPMQIAPAPAADPSGSGQHLAAKGPSSIAAAARP